MFQVRIHVSKLSEKFKKSGARNHSYHPKHQYTKVLDDKKKKKKAVNFYLCISYDKFLQLFMAKCYLIIAKKNKCKQEVSQKF